ncbi:MAG: HD domain-containing protein [Candidatus Omnitrophota bacterium]|nr:MAG: HD domain-containing protein [Candidatus Omnitrophota bacterium]
MQRYKNVFSSFHTVYRLTTTSTKIKNFITGMCRLYKNAFKAERVVMVYKNVYTHQFIKIRMEDHEQHIKKGGKSILTNKEKEILSQEREMMFDNRLIYPLVFSDSMGAIYVRRSPKQGAFNDLEKKWFLAISEEFTTGLKIFNLLQDEKRLIFNHVKSLTNFLNQYVPTSSFHPKIASRLLRIMAKEFSLSETEAKSLEYASLLHDAGKIELPPTLLSKHKPLTNEEFKIIMKHPRQGVKYIKDMELLKPAIPIILHHHEHWDGKGYPSGMKKEQIPVGARILSVIDAFDAMYYGRPYKKGRPLDEIEEEFKKQRGKQFDPKVVDVFLKVIKRKSVRKFLHAGR